VAYMVLGESFFNLNKEEIMWKERLWQVFLVVILGFVLTMCNRSASNNKSSNSGTLNADGTSTVSVSSLPTITLDNSSTLTISLANAGPSAISHTMVCKYGAWDSNNDRIRYQKCDASDDTLLVDGVITHDAAFAAGWKLVGPACGTGEDTYECYLFHK